MALTSSTIDISKQPLTVEHLDLIFVELIAYLDKYLEVMASQIASEVHDKIVDEFFDPDEVQ